MYCAQKLQSWTFLIIPGYLDSLEPLIYFLLLVVGTNSEFWDLKMSNKFKK